MNHYYQKLNTELGTLHFVSDETHLLILAYTRYWPFFKKRFPKLTNESSPVIEKLKKELAEYLAGKRKKFSIPFRLEGTEFQKKAWQSLVEIPYGETFTYSDQAKKLKKPAAVRAVASAFGKNPVSIVVPCHRVIGKSGHLTGYAGGIEAKHFLLRLENAVHESTTV